MKILVTGGAGYIGSHFVKLLLANNIEVVVFDNLSRGHREAVTPKVDFEEVDIQNYEQLNSSIKKYNIDAIVHFAAFAYVGESVEKPDIYYYNNVVGSLNLIKCAVNENIKNIVFSSTCSIYGNPEILPISEDAKVNPINPYAQTKLMIEKILSDFEITYGLKYVALRYFNAAGDDADGEIGESHDPETHLIPLVLQTAIGIREKLFVYGNDYNTKDGTCVRDYIHVNDLAEAHLKALNYLNKGGESQIINLGTGDGNSILELIETAEKITGKKIVYEISARRSGDPAILVADNKKAKKILDWEPKYNLVDILETAWKWHKNPKY